MRKAIQMTLTLVVPILVAAPSFAASLSSQPSPTQAVVQAHQTPTQSDPAALDALFASLRVIQSTPPKPQPAGFFGVWGSCSWDCSPCEYLTGPPYYETCPLDEFGREQQCLYECP